MTDLTKISAPLGRPLTWLIGALSAGYGMPAWSLPVTTNGTFTTFSSWVSTDRDASVNGTLLTSTGLVVGNNGSTLNYYQSNTLAFATSTPQVTFGYDFGAGLFAPNSLEWIPGTFDYTPPCQGCAGVPGSLFLGTIRFTNGAWFPQSDVGIRLTTSSSAASMDGHIYEGRIHLSNVSTNCPSAPTFAQANAEADYFYFISSVAGTTSNSGRVYDSGCHPPGNPGNVGDFLVWGHFGSLHLDYLTAASSGGGFTNASITDELAPSAVPEPASLSLVGLGLLGLGAARRRQRA